VTLPFVPLKPQCPESEAGKCGYYILSSSRIEGAESTII